MHNKEQFIQQYILAIVTSGHTPNKTHILEALEMYNKIKEIIRI